MQFCMAYARESLEMVLDAHIRAFEFFGGSCRKGIYDNLKTAVTKVLMGKDRQFNRRFLNMASHYLFEPVACTPAAGWEKGQVESQVKFIRHRLFVPRLKFADIDELNHWLADRCLTMAAGHKHLEFRDRTVSEYYAQEKEHLVAVSAPFDGYKELLARVVSTSKRPDGDRQFVGILGPVTLYGLEAVNSACAEALGTGAASWDLVLNILCRVHDDPAVGTYEPPPYLPELRTAPIANCSRYDDLLSSGGAYAAG